MLLQTIPQPTSRRVLFVLTFIVFVGMLLSAASAYPGFYPARDPGVRRGAADAGGHLYGLNDI